MNSPDTHESTKAQPAKGPGSGRLGRRLALGVFLVSALVTGVITMLELYWQYRVEVDEIATQFISIERSMVPALAEAVWVEDPVQIRTILGGLASLRDVESATVIAEGVNSWSAGALESKHTMVHTVPLKRFYKSSELTIGSLEIVASVDNIYGRLWNMLFVTLCSNAVKTALVVFFMLYLFQRLVGRHLQQIARHALSLASDSAETLALERAPAVGLWRPDILDEVVAAVNLANEALSAQREQLKSQIAALHESEERLRLSTELGRVAVWEYHFETDRMERSPNHDQLYGLPWQTEWEMNTFLEATHPDDRARSLETIQRSVAPGGPDEYAFDFQVVYPDQSIHWLYVVGQVVERAQNRQGLVVRGCLSDITKRKQAEESLKVYAKRLQNLHQIDQGILRAIDSPEKITQEAICNLRDLLHCQCITVGMFDVEKQEARIFAAIGAGDSVKQTKQAVPEALYGDLDILRQGQLQIIEDSQKMDNVPAIIKSIQADGVRSSLNAPINSPSGLIGALSIGWETPRTITPDEQDIASEVAGQIAIAVEQARLLQETKRHAEELEEQVRLRTTQLEATNKELEAFSYSVSHDLRAPLRHINGYVDMLNDLFREALPEQARRYLESVAESAKQMGVLIDDLLQFSRTGRQELRRKDMDMNAVLLEVLETLKTDTQSRKISWTIAVLPRVYGDYSLVKQVWMNLLDNAVKYTRNKVEAEIEIGFTKEPGYWVFFVRDNGVGFDMRYAHKLFGVFQRLHSLDKFEGTGIGLANVQRIIHKHKGRAWAEAQPDKGAVFYFTIPINTLGEGGKP